MVATVSGGSPGQDHEPENMAPGLKESRNIKRGDIFWATFSVSNGDASEGSGPVLIIQNNVGNEHGSTVIAAMITSRLSKRIYPVNVRIPEGVLPKASEVKLHQLHPGQASIGRQDGASVSGDHGDGRRRPEC